MTELVLIRHGESEVNVGTSTDPNCMLTDAGLEQARCLGRRLAGYDLGGFTALTSPYRRAVQTAGAIAEATGLTFADEPAVREWGRTAVVNGRAYSEEPIGDVVRRLHAFLQTCHGRRLVIVSHAAPIALLTQLAWGEPPDTKGAFWSGVGNCCLRWLRVTCGTGEGDVVDREWGVGGGE